MATLLLWLTRLGAVAALLPAFFVTWYLAGADGTPRSGIAPVFGLGVLAMSVWGAIASFRTLPVAPYRGLAILAAPALLLLLSWPFAGTTASGRPGAGEHLEATAVLAAPALVALLYVVVSRSG